MGRFLVFISAPLVLLTGLIIITNLNDFGEAAEVGKGRNIFFNSRHYEEEHEDLQEKLLHRLNKICPNHTQAIEEKLQEGQRCASEISDDEKTMCQIVEEDLETCWGPLFNLLETCVPEKAKGLPTYSLKTANAIFKYICDINGAHLLELGNPCILKRKHPETSENRLCIKKFKRDLLKYGFNNLPEKEAVCLFLKDFKPCFKGHLENSCQDNITRKAYLGLYDKFLCRNDTKV